MRIKPNTVILACVLIAPFGLALHDDLTRDTPDALELIWGRPLTEDSGFGHLAQQGNDGNDLWRTTGGLGGDLGYDADSLTGHEIDETYGLDEPTPIMTADAMAELFGERAATLGTRLTVVGLGMTREQVAAALPMAAQLELNDTLRFPGTSVAFEFQAGDNDQLSAVHLTIRDIEGSVERFLIDRWGEPRADDEDHGQDVWLSADGHMRVAMSMNDAGTLDIRFSRVMSPADVP